jgi:hypothetical protein
LRQKTGRDQGGGIAGARQLIVGQLFADELVVGFIRVKGLDHIVAEMPGVRPVIIEFITAAVGIPRQVEPMAAPSVRRNADLPAAFR